MNEEIITQINSMNLDDLGLAARVVLSNIYNRLRDEEGFGREQQCSVLSFGPTEYDIKLEVKYRIWSIDGSMIPPTYYSYCIG